MELKGTTSVITGASGRLGSVIAESLGRAGCNCICHYSTNKEKAADVVGRIKTFGVKALAVEADLTKAGQIESLFQRASEFGDVRVLINSAAVFSRQPLEAVTFEEARKVLDLNLTAAVLTSRAFAKLIKAKYGASESVLGKIVNIADVGGIRPWAEYTLYCSSKAALIGATKALAKELAPAICVNAVAPGIINWPGEFDECERRRQLSLIPLKRIGEPDEVGDAIIFLLENDYLTGQVLNIDGGRCI